MINNYATPVLKPQPGPQWDFATTEADVAILGGSAGVGKSFSLLLDPTRHFHRPKFGCVTLRRTETQLKKIGGIWDESYSIYPFLGGIDRQKPPSWVFPSGSRHDFGAIEYEKSLLDWHSAQIGQINFDELQQFTGKMFWYMFSRNRSMSGMRPIIRGGCNPDPDCFLADLLQWWIDEDTGFPIPERSGVLRWGVRSGHEIKWFDGKGDAIDWLMDCGLSSNEAIIVPKSYTFIPGNVYDNKILLETDPNYLANLKALAYVDRMRLLEGNWKVRATAGNFFKREWFEFVDAVPAERPKTVRYWDRACTEVLNGNDPDWTVGVKMSRCEKGYYWIEDVVRDRVGPLRVERMITNTASVDERRTVIGIEQDPGQAGKVEAQMQARNLAGYRVKLFPVNTDKQTRAKTFSAQCEAGNVKIMKGKWNKAFMDTLENFPEGLHDDDVDAASGAFNYLTTKKTIKVH